MDDGCRAFFKQGRLMAVGSSSPCCRRPIILLRAPLSFLPCCRHTQRAQPSLSEAPEKPPCAQAGGLGGGATNRRTQWVRTAEDWALEGRVAPVGQRSSHAPITLPQLRSFESNRQHGRPGRKAPKAKKQRVPPPNGVVSQEARVSGLLMGFGRGLTLPTNRLRALRRRAIEEEVTRGPHVGLTRPIPQDPRKRTPPGDHRKWPP